MSCSQLFVSYFGFSFFCCRHDLHSFPTRRSSDLHLDGVDDSGADEVAVLTGRGVVALTGSEVGDLGHDDVRSEEHTSELQSRGHLVCRLLLEKKKTALSGCRLLEAAGYFVSRRLL